KQEAFYEVAGYFPEGPQIESLRLPLAGESLVRPASAPFEPLPFEPDPEKPLRLMYAGPCFSSGGVEQHARSLGKFLNPRRIRLTVYLVTGSEPIHERFKAGVSFSIQPCGSSEFAEVVRDADVVLMWG